METIQFKLIEEYLQEYKTIEKIILNLPSYYSTLRFVSLPVKNRKKIEQMVPFQLDNELPYPLAESHLSIFPIITQKGSYTIALSTHTEKFDKFFNHIQSLSPSPSAIIGNESIYQTFVFENNLEGSIAIIDFGHRDSICYLFYNSRLVGVETSFVCGHVIDEVIAETYKIDIEEAISFKHENAFFLTDDQIDKVDENQKSFSLLMRKVFASFVDDFKRWDISCQLKTKQSVKKIFITGGISNIENIHLFLSQELGVQVKHFSYWQGSPLDRLGLSTLKLRSLANCYGLSYHVTTKKGLSNFRGGVYAVSGEREFRLDSISFIGVRSMMICLILLIIFIFENIHLSRIDKKMSREISQVLKNPSFKITPAKRRKMLRNPPRLLSFIDKKNEEIKRKMAIFEEISRTDGVGALADLSRVVKRSFDVELIQYKKRG